MSWVCSKKGEVNMANVKSTKIHDSFGDKVLNFITGAILVLIILIVGYPILYVISCSFTSTEALSAGMVVLWPVNVDGKFAISLEAYEFVMQYKAVWTGFRNSVFYTVCDVFLQMTMTILVAYPLSRRYFQGRSIYTMIFYMSTRVSAGLIPGFILKCDLGLFDNIWAVLISGSVSVSHILILRTCFQTAIPGELFDSAMIDGANHFQCVTKIALPLAKATLSVLILYCIVGQWNEYFTSMLYLRNAKLYPLQLVLRPIMQAATAVGQMDTANMTAAAQQQAQSGLENVRYALIVISSAPVIAAYFVVQKYFKGGVMLGSVKG
jgi:multiple sugar transport system permease protein/putative aldouronate transport system permease protein